MLNFFISANLPSIMKKGRGRAPNNDSESALTSPSALDFILDSAHHSLLTHDAEIELGKRIEAGDNTARDELVNNNVRLVISVANKYQGSGVPLDDLIQEANIGLLHAAERYDYRRGLKFSSYATWWIKQAVTRAIDNNSRNIRLPSYILGRISQLNKAGKSLEANLGREPTNHELAVYMDKPVEEVNELVESRDLTTVSLDTLIGPDMNRSDTLMDFISDGNNDSGELLGLHDLIGHYLSNLTPREQYVISLRYGLDGKGERTLTSIGKEMGVTKERIRQIEVKALKKLKIAFNPSALDENNVNPMKTRPKPEYDDNPEAIQKFDNFADKILPIHRWYCTLTYRHGLSYGEVLDEFKRLGLDISNHGGTLIEPNLESTVYEKARRITGQKMSPDFIREILAELFKPIEEPYETDSERIRTQIKSGMESLSSEEKLFLELRYRDEVSINDIRRAFFEHGYVNKKDGGHITPFSLKYIRGVAADAYIKLNSSVHVRNLGVALAEFYGKKGICDYS